MTKTQHKQSSGQREEQDAPHADEPKEETARFVFVGNKAKKAVKDRETGKEYWVPADPHEPDHCEMTFAARRFFFPKGSAVEVPVGKPFDVLIGKLRGNSHFVEVDSAYKDKTPPKPVEVASGGMEAMLAEMAKLQQHNADLQIRLDAAEKRVLDADNVTDEG